MATPAFLDPNINAWWLDRSSPNDAAAATAFGNAQRIAQQQLEMKQQAMRDETATKFKMMDFALESERNQIAIATFNSKQNQDILRAKGMSEIGNYLSSAVSNGKLTDPSTQAGFFSLTSKYAPFINEQTVNSMWDNTFGNAMRREDQAKRIASGSDVPALLQYKKEIDRLESEIGSIADLELKAAKQKELDRFRNAARFVTADESIQMDLAKFRADNQGSLQDERIKHQEEMAKFRAEQQKELLSLRTSSQGFASKYKADAAAITKKYDLPILQAYKDESKRNELINKRDSELDALWNEYSKTFSSTPTAQAAPTAQAPAAAPEKKKLKFDPATARAYVEGPNGEKLDPTTGLPF